MDEIKNCDSVKTVKVYLSQDKNFKLYMAVTKNDKKRYILDANLEYKDQFTSQNYQQTRYLIETIGLFAHRYDLDIDCDDFEVVQQKNDNNKIQKTLFCKFLKSENPDKDIYLNRGMCKTIQTLFYEAMQGYSKNFLLENYLHKEIHASSVDLKSSNEYLVQNSQRIMNQVLDAEMPDQIKKIVCDFINEYDKK